MTIGKKITLGYALAMAALFILSSLAYRSTTQLIENNERVDHTHKVLNGLDRAARLLKDAETGQRGFLLTGNEDYCNPTTMPGPRSMSNGRSLRTLMADNETQQRALDELKIPIDKKLAELDKTIECAKPDGEGKQGEGFKGRSRSSWATRARTSWTRSARSSSAWRPKRRGCWRERTDRRGSKHQGHALHHSSRHPPGGGARLA